MGGRSDDVHECPVERCRMSIDHAVDGSDKLVADAGSCTSSYLYVAFCESAE